MIKLFGRALAILMLLLTLVVAVVLAVAWFTLPLDGIAVTVDGATYSLGELLQGPRAVLVFFVAVVAVVMAVIAALTMVVVGLAVGALGLAFGLVTAAASLALVAAPFALVGWLLWRLFRQRPVAIATAP